MTTSPMDQWAHELEDLWSIEEQLREALPENTPGADEDFKQVLKDHQARTEEHLERLRGIYMAGMLADRMSRRTRSTEKAPRRTKRRDRKGLIAGA